MEEKGAIFTNHICASYPGEDHILHQGREVCTGRRVCALSLEWSLGGQSVYTSSGLNLDVWVCCLIRDLLAQSTLGRKLQGVLVLEQRAVFVQPSGVQHLLSRLFFVLDIP